LRRQIHQGLNVIENWNSANGFIFLDRGGEVASNRLEDQEVSVLALHLFQSCLVYINTLMLLHVLAEPGGWHRMGDADRRARSDHNPIVPRHGRGVRIFTKQRDRTVAD